ncbi:MAG: WbuC family cupin fold metalloprotein [Alistipes sp.]|nr:WbuC family cupin fold metalloprotein [Alistipes sp.]
MLIDDNLLDDVASEARISERLRMNRDMRNSASDSSQRMLNALEIGTVLPIHRHTTTSETQLLLRGRIDVMFYDNLGRETERFHLDPRNGKYGVNIPIGQWHNLEVLEPAVIFEAKDGPYKPIEPEDVLY